MKLLNHCNDHKNWIDTEIKVSTTKILRTKIPPIKEILPDMKYISEEDALFLKKVIINPYILELPNNISKKEYIEFWKKLEESQKKESIFWKDNLYNIICPWAGLSYNRFKDLLTIYITEKYEISEWIKILYNVNKKHPLNKIFNEKNKTSEEIIIASTVAYLKQIDSFDSLKNAISDRKKGLLNPSISLMEHLFTNKKEVFAKLLSFHSDPKKCKISIIALEQALLLGFSPYTALQQEL